MSWNISSGDSFPLGATPFSHGVNFAVYSSEAEHTELLFFDSEDDNLPCAVFSLDKQNHRTYHYWHIFVHGARKGQLYGWKAYGPPSGGQNGNRFDKSKLLIDPYARAVVGFENYSRKVASIHGQEHMALKSVVLDVSDYDWEGDRHPRIPYSNSVIYELHVGGFTRHPSSGVRPDKRGTFHGLIEKIPYLKELGITAVELLPVQLFDEQDAPPGLINYWGYSPMSYFAPHWRYASKRSPEAPLDEFRDMVKAFHSAGMEVILDVVFNHTTENDDTGPTLSFRGLDDKTYYIVDPISGDYKNYSGCGNTLKAENPVVSRLIIDSLHFWVREMHVDGFRFDLASILSRDRNGHPLDNPFILSSIESDPVLAGTKLIAEAWDAAGLYRSGWFVHQGDWFAEWNDSFRDDIRRFVRGDRNMVYSLRNRLLGSPDIFTGEVCDTNRSINFVACHDGFTLQDLVSYNRKHNLSNKENNRDGADCNFSWNCGLEGETSLSMHKTSYIESGKSAPGSVEKLRSMQLRNFLCLLFLSQGTPMLAMGDESRRTTAGNNNTYCQDNELSWLDWGLVEKNKDLFRFCRCLIRLTQSSSLFQQTMSLSEQPESDTGPGVLFHGVRLGQPDYAEWSHSLAFELYNRRTGEALYAAFNSYCEDLEFELPPLVGHRAWLRIVDTSLEPPNDFFDSSDLVNIAQSSNLASSSFVRSSYRVRANSTLVLLLHDSC